MEFISDFIKFDKNWFWLTNSQGIEFLKSNSNSYSNQIRENMEFN